MGASNNGFFTHNANINLLYTILLSPRFVASMGFSLKAHFPEGNTVRIFYSHGVTLSSWGENINITLTPLDDCTTQVHIFSECTMPTQIFDWGKNTDNINKINQYLCVELMNYQTPAPPQAASFCPNCGSAVTPGQRFCASCGTMIIS